MKAQAIYEQVTASIVEAIEAGIANPNGWQKPWKGGNGIQSFNHRNVTTNQRYQGFNQLALFVAARDKGYRLPKWATFKQWETMGGKVCKGEKATHLIKWVVKPCKPAHPANVICSSCGNGFPVGFAVFNAEQVDGHGLEMPPIVEVESVRFDDNERAEELIRGAVADGLVFRHMVGDRAYYEPNYDMITLPEREQFVGADGYYSTALHELSHASGHPKRLSRDMGKRFGDQKYAMEELVAELGSAFLCADAGVIDNGNLQHANYLANWLQVLKADAKALPHVAAQAERAATYWIEAAKRVGMATAAA